MNNHLILFEVTNRCNENCIYCYNVWHEDKHYKQGELKFKDIKKLFNKILKEIQIKNISLIGGEPLVHPDIVKIVSYFKAKKIKTSISSNGLLLNENLLKKIIKNGIDHFEISLNTINSKIINEYYNNYSLKKVKNTILNIKQNDKKLTIFTIISNLNYNEIDKIIDLAFAFSVDHIVLSPFIVSGRARKYKKLLVISLDKIKQVLAVSSKKSIKYNLPISYAVPMPNCVINKNNYPGIKFGSCVCGEKKWVIDPIGNLRTCELNPVVLGNLFKEKFENIVQNDYIKKFKNQVFKPECSACDYFRNKCDFCKFYGIY